MVLIEAPGLATERNRAAPAGVWECPSGPSGEITPRRSASLHPSPRRAASVHGRACRHGTHLGCAMDAGLGLAYLC